LSFENRRKRRGVLLGLLFDEIRPPAAPDGDVEIAAESRRLLNRAAGDAPAVLLPSERGDSGGEATEEEVMGAKDADDEDAQLLLGRTGYDAERDVPVRVPIEPPGEHSCAGEEDGEGAAWPRPLRSSPLR
jgi:hypothetical protein